MQLTLVGLLRSPATRADWVLVAQAAFGDAKTRYITMLGNVVGEATTAPSTSYSAGWNGDSYTLVGSAGASTGTNVANHTCYNDCIANGFGNTGAQAVAAAIQQRHANFTVKLSDLATDAERKQALETIAGALLAVFNRYGDASTAPGVGYSAAAPAATSAFLFNCLANPMLGACINAGASQLLVVYFDTDVAALSGWFPISDAGSIAFGASQTDASKRSYWDAAGLAGAGIDAYSNPSMRKAYSATTGSHVATATSFTSPGAACSNPCTENSFAARAAATAAPLLLTTLKALPSFTPGPGSTPSNATVSAILKVLNAAYAATATNQASSYVGAMTGAGLFVVASCGYAPASAACIKAGPMAQHVALVSTTGLGGARYFGYNAATSTLGNDLGEPTNVDALVSALNSVGAGWVQHQGDLLLGGADTVRVFVQPVLNTTAGGALVAKLFASSPLMSGACGQTCRFQSFGRRGSTSAAAVVQDNPTLAWDGAQTMADISAIASVMIADKRRQDSEAFNGISGVAVASTKDWYMVVSCLGRTAAYHGCIAAGPGAEYVFSTRNFAVFRDDVRHIFAVDENALASTIEVANETKPYDPTVRNESK